MTTLDMWSEEFSGEIIALAKDRILKGGNLAIRSDVSKRTVKLALILVRILNPPEDLLEQELAILMGVSRTTLRKSRQDKEFLQVINR